MCGSPSPAAADPPPRIERRAGWSGRLHAWPYPLVMGGYTVNATPRIALSVRAGTVLLLHGAEAEVRFYVGKANSTLYLYGGGVALRLEIEDPDESTPQSRYRAGLFGGLGFEVMRARGHFAAVYAGVYTADVCLASERLCAGGGVALGRRW